MSRATTTHELSPHERGFLAHVQAPATEAHPEVTGAETDDMSPRARKIIYLTLLAGVLFLAGLAAYVWYGSYQWLRIA